MPARVHALVVVHPDARTSAALHLGRTLSALGSQTRRPDAVTIVVCGQAPDVADVVESADANPLPLDVVALPAGTGYAAAVAAVTGRADEGSSAPDAYWLLAQDTAPEPDAFARLAGSLELAPSVAFVAPKLVRWDDPTEIVSLGVTMTRFGRTVELADGELDQGQHDGRDDALGSDIRGVLIRRDAWESLGGIDQALRGADEGLDLGVRARLSGARVALVPAARVAVAGDGVAGLPGSTSTARRQLRGLAERTAQLHRRLAYAHPVALPIVWLAILPLAVWRTALLLVRKQPGLVAAEWGASTLALVRLRALFRSRRRIARARTASWKRIAPLRTTGRDLRERIDEGPGASIHHRRELDFFTGGGAWLVLAALVASVVAFPALLAWPALGGGALQPLRATFAQLWSDTAFGVRALGVDTVGPADPFAVVVALVGSLWPGDPSRALVLLWVLALPLAALGGWFAATRVTNRPILRIAGGVAWALAPAFLAALTSARPTALFVHLLLSWLFYAGSVAHRSWVAAGAASLLLAAVVACAPSLAVALGALWATAVVLTVVLRAGRGLSRVIWLVIPSLALSAPIAISRLRAGDVWALAADPGVPWAGAQNAADPAGRALLAAGFPAPDLAGWIGFAGGLPTWWVPLLAAPVALLALLAPLTQRWTAGIVLLVVSALGIGTAFAAVGIAVSFAQSDVVAVWPGAGLSLAWLGALGGALTTLDAGLAPRLAPVRTATAVVVMAALAVLSIPALTAMHRGVSELQNGPRSTLPAFVAAEGRGDPDVGTLVLTPQNDEGVSSRLVWGASETLGSQSTLVSTRTQEKPSDDALADVTADLVLPSATDAVADIAARGIGFVLLAPAVAPESESARTFRLAAENALNQREGLAAVGDTDKGALWRVTVDVAARAAPSASVVSTARWIATVQFAVAAIAVLLAVPTSASRRAAHRSPRIVGVAWREGR